MNFSSADLEALDEVEFQGYCNLAVMLRKSKPEQHELTLFFDPDKD